jgi:tungstate transport system substrate-binding protein
MRDAPVLVLLAASLAAAGGGVTERVPPDKGVVRAAVIGGMTMTGLWPAISQMFEEQTGLKVVVVATGPRPGLAAAFQAGRADLLTMHSGDITTDLVADGYGVNLRPWTRNDLVIVGPASDPAKVRGLKDGVEAFRRIAAAKAPFVEFHDIGSQETCHQLWQRAGLLPPRGDWLLKDETANERDIVLFAEQKGAYVVVGRMPVLFGKMPSGSMQILVEGDPTMRRPYMVMEANPKRFPQANHAGARALSDFLLSEKVQRFLLTFGTDRGKGLPLFYPVWPYAPEVAPSPTP